MEQVGICPWCGVPVILKQGPYGRFYGCSNYPACRYRRHS
ncbi:topoisomerase DNA-binding C4 zinc finger domain-containing protein [Alistipes indistinctus]